MDRVMHVVTTTDGKSSAETIAKDLVASRLAACVQIQGPLTSVYRWKGQIEVAEEWRCTIKTIERLYREVEQRIRELHRYEEPEILAIAVEKGSETYLGWLCEQVQR